LPEALLDGDADERGSGRLAADTREIGYPCRDFA